MRVRSHTSLERDTAALLCVLLVSCSTTNYAVPVGPEELTRLVLFVQEQSDGTVTHFWKQAEEVELSQYRGLARALGASHSVVPVMGWNRDCDEENRDCIELERLQPQEFTAIDFAVDWVKQNRKEILVGSVVTIAGVAFVAVTAGAGVVILVPALLLAAPSDGTAPFMAGVAP